MEKEDKQKEEINQIRHEDEEIKEHEEAEQQKQEELHIKDL